METLKVLKAQAQAESCWKSLKERTLTKKNARENLLLNSDFNSLLQLLLDSEGNERAGKVAMDFVIKCVQSKIISPTALLTLIQQKLPGKHACKLDSIPVFGRVSGLILEIEKETSINFAFQLAFNDSRLVPFLTERFLATPEIDVDSDFISFLLGDSDLILVSSVFDDQYYKMARCRVLSHLVGKVENEKYSDLLINFLIWNSSRLCVMELDCLSQLCQFFSNNQALSTVHLELFEVYLEVICNEFLKFGSFGEAIESICNQCSEIITEYSAFKIGSLLLLRKSVDSNVSCSILRSLSKYEKLGNFSKICCAKLMMSSRFNDELESFIKNIFKLPIFNMSLKEEVLFEPFTELGILTQLGYKGLRPKCASHDDYFDLMFLSKNLNDFSSIDLGNYLKNGHFEIIFSLLAYKWNISTCRNEVLKGFLELLGDVENEESEIKILRYSWVVDFFESHFTDEMYLNFLPLICEFVTNNDNILFAFVQQKISTYIYQKENVSVQLPCMLSLFILFESSQSRQSRLNFITTITLSYFHNILSQNLIEIDTRAVILGFKLMGKLAGIAVLDPRDIWSKYVDKFFSNSFFLSNSHIRGSIYSFASSLRIIPEGKNKPVIFLFTFFLVSEGEINEIKLSGIKLLIENLATEADPFALDQICESLSKFDIEILCKVEIQLLQPEPTFDDEGNVKEVPIEDILSRSILFNPSKLFDISKRYNEVSHCYKLLWVKLIDHEVEIMPRTKFLGSGEKSSTVSEVKTNFISNSSFCNGLIFETFDASDLTSSENVLKCIKSRLMPLVPSINSLLWYVRPLLPEFLFEAVDKIIKNVDDQRIKKQLTDYEYLLLNLKMGTTPQSISTLIMVISAIMKSAFINQIISENFLFSNWISVLSKKLVEVSEFKPLIGNEEFLSAFAMSCNILSRCTSNINSVLSEALESVILNNSKIRDGVSVYCALEALSKLNLEKIENVLLDKSVSSKRKLIAGLSMLKLRRSFSLKFPDKVDDVSLMLEIISTNGKGHYPKTSFSDPLEFKGLTTYIQSLISPAELKEKFIQRAYDTGNVPAALKYDAIFAYLLGCGMNLSTLSFENCNTEELKAIENSTRDSKCLTLLQMVSRSSVNAKLETTSIGLERFDKLSWLKFIGSIKSGIKYEILSECKLLPRIEWAPVQINDFKFILKHVLSTTPITKVPYINPSLLYCFFEHVLNIVKCDHVDMDLKRIVKVLFNNTDERSSKTLCEILDYYISVNYCYKLKILLEESLKFPQDLLKYFDFCRFNSLKPENLSALGTLINSLAKQLSFDASKIAIINTDNESVFKIIQNILSNPDCSEFNDLKLKVLSVNILNLCGKERIKSCVDVIDLMFIYQNDETKFSILSKLLYEIFNDLSSILLDSSIFANDSEIVNKFRARASVIPKDIFDRLDSQFTSFEYGKLAF